MPGGVAYRLKFAKPIALIGRIGRKSKKAALALENVAGIQNGTITKAR